MCAHTCGSPLKNFGVVALAAIPIYPLMQLASWQSVYKGKPPKPKNGTGGETPPVPFLNKVHRTQCFFLHCRYAKPLFDIRGKAAIFLPGHGVGVGQIIFFYLEAGF